MPALYKRFVNSLIRAGLEALDPAQPIGFFCECAQTECFETVYLNGEEYDRRRAGSAWAVLAPGHRRFVERAAASVT